MANEVVKYHNDMASVSYPNFTQADHNFFAALCYECKGKGTDVHPITYDVLKNLSGFSAKDDKRFVKYLDEFTEKLFELRYRSYGKNGAFEKFNLFEGFVNDPEKRIFWVGTTNKFAYILNSDDEYIHGGVLSFLSAGYTTYELRQHNGLKSTYSKIAFRQLKRFKRTGWWKVSVDEFERLMDIPETYRLPDLRRRVLKPIKDELSSYFDNLEIEEISGKGDSGRTKTVELKFTFTPQLEKGVWFEDDNKAVLQDEYRCPFCGDKLYWIVRKSGDFFYGHKDGWKANAPCKHTFSSLEEILGENGGAAPADTDASGKPRPEKAGFSCRECGRPLYKLYNDKNEMFYGHIDGYKKDAPCRKTYGSIADLKGYKETPTRADYKELVEKNISSDIEIEQADGVFETTEI